METDTRSWAKRKWTDFEGFVEGVIYDRDLSVSARLFGLFLHPFSYLFSAIVRLRLFLYSNRIIFRDKPLDCLDFGCGKPDGRRNRKDTGSRKVYQRIVGQGQKGRDPEPWLQKQGRTQTFFLVPTLEKRQIPPQNRQRWRAGPAGFRRGWRRTFHVGHESSGAIVLADKDRVKAGRFAIDNFRADALILDDGFQYLPLKGTLNLLLVDQTNPFGNRCLLPRGILREPVRHLSRASYVFLTKSEVEPELELLQTIRKYNKKAEIIRCVHKPKFFKEINGEQIKPLDLLREAYVGVFCGIASPRGFEQLILRMSGEMRFRRRFLDHYRYEVEELDRLFLQAKNAGADIMVTTEKDAVRIPLGYKPIMPLYYVRMEIEIIEGFEDFEEAVAGICFTGSEKNSMSTPSVAGSENSFTVA